MAEISKSDTAPKDAEHFSLGAVEFDLTDKNTIFETDDPAVIANARANPALSVKEDPQPVATIADAADPLDPHVNPAADHLSAFASPEAIAAADTNEQAIKEATGGDVSAPTEAPTVEETLSATLTAAGVQSAPALPPVPEADAQPSASTPATPPPTPPAPTPVSPASPSNGSAGSTSTTSGSAS